MNFEWVRWYFGKWHTGTKRLSLEERGAYVTVCTMINMEAARGGRLADIDADIAREGWMPLRTWKRLKASLIEKGKLTVENGFLINERAAAEGDHAKELVLKRKSAGTQSGIVRRTRRNETDNKVGNLVANNSENNGLDGTPVGTNVQTHVEASVETPVGTDVRGREEKEREEERKKEKNQEQKKKEEVADAPGRYAFEGVVVRLLNNDLETWRKRFSHIRDIEAMLTSRDAFLAGEPEKDRKRWFISTAAWLANKNEDAARSDDDGGWDGIGV